MNEAVDDVKIKNTTQSTKTKIQKFYNGDFAGVIKKTRIGGYVFNVKDALYEGDYHNSLIPLCERKTIVLKESDLRIMVKKCVKKILAESEQHYNIRKIGKWDCIPSNGYEFHKIPGKGTCVGIMMYVDSTSKKKKYPQHIAYFEGEITESTSMLQSLPHQKMALKQRNFR